MSTIELLNDEQCVQCSSSKILLMVSFQVCWLLTIIWLKSEVIIIGRAVAGIGNAMCYVVTPTYIKEISDDNIRGTLCSFLVLAQNLGFISMYVIGDLLSFKTVLWISLIVPVIHFIVFLSAPESPSYLVKKKKLEVST